MTEEPVSDPVSDRASDLAPDDADSAPDDGRSDVVGDIEESVGDDRPERSGMEGVDSVMDDVAALSGRPVEEHAEVFDSAHERLRRTLDEPPPDAEA